MDFDDLFDPEGDNFAQEGGADNNAQGFGDDLFMFSGLDQNEADQLRDQKDSVLFLIDCHSSMFQENPHNKGSSDTGESSSSIHCVLTAALSFMKTKIITSDTDKIGIVLYGCGVTDNSLNFNNIAVVQKLDTPDAATIKSFQD